MAIYIVQHGISLPKIDEKPDPGLAPEGVADAERIASVAKGYNVTVDRIVHSGKKRARQTAEIYDRELSPSGGITVAEGMRPMDNPIPLASQLDPASNTLYVGHLPFLNRLVSWCITGSIETPVFQLQNSGLLCMDQIRETGQWVICWALMPRLKTCSD